MCFNKETSIGAFIIGILCACILIFRGVRGGNYTDITSGMLLIVITFMQIIEYVLWDNTTCDKKNRIASYFLLITLYSQPILYYIGRLILLGTKHKIINTIILLITIILFSTFFILYIYPEESLCSQKNELTGRLEWAPLKIMYNEFIWWIFVFGLYLSVYHLPTNKVNEKCNIIRNLFQPIVFFASIIYSYIKTGKDFFSNMGSLWCFLCVFYGFVCLIFPVKKIS